MIVAVGKWDSLHALLCFYSSLHISMARYFTSTLVGSVRKVDESSQLARKFPVVLSELLFVVVLMPGRTTRIAGWYSSQLE